jgi:hypothetical protein
MRCHLGLSQSRVFDAIARILLTSVCAVCLSGTAPASAEIPSELNGLRIDVETAKRRVLIGEPLVVTLRLTNTGEDTLNVSSMINETPRGSPVSFAFLGPSEERAEWRTIYEADMVPPRGMRQLGPGDYVVARFNLAASTNPVGMGSAVYWTCPVAGSYAVIGRYRIPPGWDRSLWHGTIESSPTSFEVQEPQGVDRIAFDILNNESMVRHYLEHPPFGASTKKALRKVVAEHSASTYAVYADYLLSIRVLGRERTIEHLRRFIINHPDFPLVPDAEFRIADLMYREERFEEARAQLTSASEQYPHDAHTTDILATQMRDPSSDIKMTEANRRHRELMDRLGLTDNWYRED